MSIKPARADHPDHEHEPYIEDYFLAVATGVERLTPGMIRVILKVEGGERLIATDHADEWVRLALRPQPDLPVTLPILMESGRWGRPDGSDPCPNRPYTVRRWNRENLEMTLDLVVHDGGVASAWAQTAMVGDIVGICNPEGRYEPPHGTEWVLLLTDITGLPAVGRILEELPEDLRAVVHVEVPTAEDRQFLNSAGDVEITWHENSGEEAETNLPAIAKSISQLPTGPGYIYIAGEARAASDSRKHFRDCLGFDKHRIHAIGYWIKGQARV